MIEELIKKFQEHLDKDIRFLEYLCAKEKADSNPMMHYLDGRIAVWQWVIEDLLKVKE